MLVKNLKLMGYRKYTVDIVNISQIYNERAVIPDNWEVVTFRPPIDGEFYLGAPYGTTVFKHTGKISEDINDARLILKERENLPVTLTIDPKKMYPLGITIPRGYKQAGPLREIQAGEYYLSTVPRRDATYSACFCFAPASYTIRIPLTKIPEY